MQLHILAVKPQTKTKTKPRHITRKGSTTTAQCEKGVVTMKYAHYERLRLSKKKKKPLYVWTKPYSLQISLLENISL